MKISELTNKSFLSGAGAAENSYVVINYQDSNTDRPVTYKATLNELGKMLINNLNVVRYETENGNILATLQTDNGAYERVVVGQYITAADRTKLDHAVTDSDNLAKADVATTVTNVEYSGTNKELTQTINNNTTRIVSLALLKTDMDLANVENKSGATIRSELTNAEVVAGLGYTPMNTAARGVANGVASLDQDAKIPAAQLPSYVDDVLEYANFEGLPSTGESDKIYITLNDNKCYRWSGSVFVEISQSLALGETASTAYAGDKGALAYAHAVTNKGIAAESGLYKITTNSEGHITAVTAVTKGDLTALGVLGEHQSLDGKVDKNGTDRLMTADEGSKLAGIAAGAKVNVQSDWSVSDNTSDAYIANKPSLGAAAAKAVDSSITTNSQSENLPTAAAVAAFVEGKGYGTYSKPSGGIPAADLASGVIPNVSGFYTKPVGGIPASDLAQTYLTSSDISDLAPTSAPVFTTSITIGNTTLTETDLIALKSILPLPDTDGEYTLVRSTESDVITYTWTAQT